MMEINNEKRLDLVVVILFYPQQSKPTFMQMNEEANETRENIILYKFQEKVTKVNKGGIFTA